MKVNPDKVHQMSHEISDLLETHRPNTMERIELLTQLLATAIYLGAQPGLEPLTAEIVNHKVKRTLGQLLKSGIKEAAL